jgi:hypothetical protein
MEALSSSETSVLTRATQLNVPEDAIHRSSMSVSAISWKADNLGKRTVHEGLRDEVFQIHIFSPSEVEVFFCSKTFKNLYIAVRKIKAHIELPSQKNADFWDVLLCRSCENRRFGGTYRLHHKGAKNR